MHRYALRSGAVQLQNQAGPAGPRSRWGFQSRSSKKLRRSRLGSARLVQAPPQPKSAMKRWAMTASPSIPRDRTCQIFACFAISSRQPNGPRSCARRRKPVLARCAPTPTIFTPIQTLRQNRAAVSHARSLAMTLGADGRHSSARRTSQNGRHQQDAYRCHAS